MPFTKEQRVEYDKAYYKSHKDKINKKCKDYQKAKKISKKAKWNIFCKLNSHL